jgi:hypothetical protein
LKLLPGVIEFGANAEGAAVLAAMKGLPDVLAYRRRLTAPLIPARTIEHGVVNGPWKRLVFGHPEHEGGAVNRHAYTFCVLEQFWRALKRREIYADASTRWRNPQASLLTGPAWEAVRPDVLTTLGLPEDPDALLADRTATLDAAYRHVGGGLAANTEVRVDDAGKIHLTGVKAVEGPPSLVDLRNRTTAMLPRVDLPEVILEVMSWDPPLAAAFTAVSGGRSRLEDLPTSIAACLAAHSMNVGYRPIAKAAWRGWSGRGCRTCSRTTSGPRLSPRPTFPWSPARPGSRWRRCGAAGWSPRSTGCGSSSRSLPRSPAPTGSSSDRGAA